MTFSLIIGPSHSPSYLPCLLFLLNTSNSGSSRDLLSSVSCFMAVWVRHMGPKSWVQFWRQPHLKSRQVKILFMNQLQSRSYCKPISLQRTCSRGRGLASLRFQSLTSYCYSPAGICRVGKCLPGCHRYRRDVDMMHMSSRSVIRIRIQFVDVISIHVCT